MDESKDQSYFLWQIPRDHLSQILFPLGNMLKSEVREKARELGLLTAGKPDSMGICFIGEVNVNKLLKDRLGEKLGEVVIKYSSIGTHKGLWFHTIGERGGFEIDKAKLKKLGLHPEKMGPLYVVAKNKEKNELVVGTREETMKKEFDVNSQIINSPILKWEGKLWVRIRNLGELYKVKSLKMVNSKLEIETAEAVFGVAEGQSAVFYDEEGVLVGGGIIV